MAEAITKKIELRVIAPTMATDKSPYKFKKAVDMAIMRCTTGDMGILPGRVPVAMVLDTGILRIYDEDQVKHMVVVNGIANVNDDIITILSDCVQLPEEIDTAKVSAELKELQDLREKTTDLNEKQNYSKEIYRCKVQLEVAEYKK